MTDIAPMELEELGKCPVCGDPARTPEVQGATDITHGVAQGAWTYYRCAHCRSVYLDPRPSQADIKLAYGSYQTHAAPEDPFKMPTSWLRKLSRLARNAYVHRKYGYDLRPRSALLGRLLALMLPVSRSLDSWVRLAHRDTAGRVLDVGSGNCSFVALMHALGWQSWGVEFDEKAVAWARQQGLNVLEGTIDAVQDDAFDLITFNHVLEHVHDPGAFLRQCYQRLVPGGRLWVGTPNFDGFGYRIFGKHWRGLEAPRHLVLLNPDGLARLLRDAGFCKVEQRRTPWWAFDQFGISSRLRGDSPAVRRWLVPVLAAFASLAGEISPRYSEELVFTCERPG
jgi:2-polyprenyl-3-methyl-5-hydroxy-6-metoxy-1,4-benzoquinol methylase